MKIQQRRNATLIITYGGKRFLIDPMFAPKDSYAPIAIGPNPNLSWPTCDLPKPANEIYDDIDVIINQKDSLGPLEILKEQLDAYGDESVTRLGLDVYTFLSKDKIDEADEILNHFFDDYYHKDEDEETETEEEGEAESADEKDIQVTFKEVLE